MIESKLLMNKIFQIPIKRFFAALIDYILFLLFIAAYVIFLGERKNDGTFEVKGVLHIIILWIVWIIYFPVIETRFGYTLGKGLFDLKVIGINGHKISFSQACKRHILDFVDFILYGFIAVISLNQNKKFQRLGDLWAKTYVVQDNDIEKSQHD